MKAYRALLANPVHNTETEQAELRIFKLAILNSQCEVLKHPNAKMQQFLMKNLTLNQTEEMPGFQRVVELVLLLLSIKYDKFTDYKQVLKARLSESGVK